MYEYVWLYMTFMTIYDIYDYVWLYDYVLCININHFVWIYITLTLNDSVWLSTALFEYIWLCLTTYDIAWLTMYDYV